MNKYSSKAIKTAATVGMSLAMVLSNVAPVLAAAQVAAPATCNIATNGVKDFLDNVISIEEFANANSTTTVDMSKATLDGANQGTTPNLNLFIALSAANSANEYEDIYSYIAKVITDCSYADEYRVSAVTMRDTVKEYMSMFTDKAYGTALAPDDLALAKSTDDDDTFNGTLVDTIDMAKGGLLKQVFDKLVKTDNTSDNEYAVSNLGTGTNLKDARADLKKLNTFFDKYAGNLTSEEEAAFVLVKDALEQNITEYAGDTDEQTLADFVLSFDAVLQGDLDGKTINTTVNAKGASITIAAATGYSSTTTMSNISLSSSSQIKSRMNKIKNHDRYEDFKDEDAVVAIMDAYQALLDNIDGTKDVFKSDSYNDYNKTKVANRTAAYDDITVKKLVNLEVITDEKELAEVINSDEFAILKAVKEDVMDELYTMETKKIGNYHVDKSGFVDTATSAQQSTFRSAFPSYLWALVDTETGEFGYDKVAARMEKVAADLKAVTTDIEKLTPANIKASDKSLLEAAEDAIYNLYGGKYTNNLTADEYKAVRKADTKITNLREAFDNLGVTNVAGWYSMGNGNWGYNNEDGTPAAYKWVASGADWYMIKDGKMLRNTWLATDGGRWYYLDNAGKMVTNQSVDGCWINSYGVYMSTSYNG